MRVGIIGMGAIGGFVRQQALADGHEILAVLLRPERIRDAGSILPGVHCVESVDALPGDVDYMIDCAGHAALQAYGTEILHRGMDLITVSLGALADQGLLESLQEAAVAGDSRLHLASGAIGALDSLRAAIVGGLQSVTYTGRKSPDGWRGSPAESRLDLSSLTAGAAIHFEGTARTAAIEYPKNANVAAAVALAGVGFDDTQVKLIADADITENIHEIEAVGAFGRFHFEIRGRSLPDNPRSSALAAMSVIASLRDKSQRIAF